jgi:hypothetical protein
MTFLYHVHTIHTELEFGRGKIVEFPFLMIKEKNLNVATNYESLNISSLNISQTARRGG